jgi:hypothetical protein
MSYAFPRDVPAGDHHHAKVRATIGAAALPAGAGRPEPGTERPPIPPTTCSAGEPGCGANSAQAAARQRLAQARARQWRAELSGDPREHRSATAAAQRGCGELAQVSTIAPATGHVTAAEENRP